MKTLVGIGLVAGIFASVAAHNDKFKISTKRADDTVAVQTEGDKTVFSVKSLLTSARRTSNGWLSGRKPWY